MVYHDSLCEMQKGRMSCSCYKRRTTLGKSLVIKQNNTLNGSPRFPMLDGPTIDWGLAKKIYSVYSCLYRTGQSLNRIAERGGFGWSEIPVFYQRHKQKRCNCNKEAI